MVLIKICLCGICISGVVSLITHTKITKYQIYLDFFLENIAHAHPHNNLNPSI